VIAIRFSIDGGDNLFDSSNRVSIQPKAQQFLPMPIGLLWDTTALEDGIDARLQAPSCAWQYDRDARASAEDAPASTVLQAGRGLPTDELD